MKVLDLIENDEWTSKPITVQYLFKKQMAATHAFKVEVDKLLRTVSTNPPAAGTFFKNSADLRAISRWKTLPTMASGLLQSNISVDGLGSSLKAKYDKMLDAKYKYEEAGGKYSTDIAIWEVPA